VSADARLRHLVGLAQAMSAAQSEREAVHAAARLARDALHASMAAISVWERETGRLRVLVNYGELAPDEEELPEDESYPVADYPEIAHFLEQRGLGEPWTSDGLPRAWVQTADEPAGEIDPAEAELPVPGLSRNGPFCRERVAGLRRRGRGCCLVAPIVLRGRAWGELYLARRPGEPVFDDHDAEFATVLAAQISAGLAQSERLAEVSRLAFTDALTGLANRRAVDARLDEALEAHRADGTVVSLVMCDVNGLKQVNDERGHEVGDQLLERFGNQLSVCSAMLPGSVAGRLGGDEFCLVVAGIPTDEVIRVAEELCARALQIGEGQGVACGVASTGDPIGPVTTADRLFRLADAAQYRAKAARAAHPVVAGRGSASGSGATDPTVRLADAPPAASGPRPRRGERRRFRGALRSADPGQFISAVLDALDSSEFPNAADPRGVAGGDGPAPGTAPPRVHPADTLGRLGVVAEAACRLVDAVAWWVSYLPPGTLLMRTAAYGVQRMTVPRGARGAGQARAAGSGAGEGGPGGLLGAGVGGGVVGAGALGAAGLAGAAREPDPARAAALQRATIEAPDAVFDLRSYPLTARAVRGGAFTMRAGAPGNDPAEEAVLIVGGYRAMVAAGGTNAAGGWLLELFADESTLPLSGLAPALRTLVATTINGPASVPE